MSDCLSCTTVLHWASVRRRMRARAHRGAALARRLGERSERLQLGHARATVDLATVACQFERPLAASKQARALLVLRVARCSRGLDPAGVPRSPARPQRPAASPARPGHVLMVSAVRMNLRGPIPGSRARLRLGCVSAQRELPHAHAHTYGHAPCKWDSKAKGLIQRRDSHAAGPPARAAGGSGSCSASRSPRRQRARRRTAPTRGTRSRRASPSVASRAARGSDWTRGAPTARATCRRSRPAAGRNMRRRPSRSWKASCTGT